LEKKLFKKKK